MGGIAPAELAVVRDRLEGFAADLFESLPRKDQRARGECYLRGLMLEGRRKSIEPIAARLGGEVRYQALHHFVAVSPWDWRPVRRRLAERLVTALEPTAWAVDDTGFPKDGTPRWGPAPVLGHAGQDRQLPAGGVGQRRHCAGQLPAGLAVVPAGVLEDDTTRRAACQVPASVRHRPKWRLVLDMLDGLERWGLRPPMLVADSGYGEVGAFRQGLDDRQIPYVVQVKADTSAYPEQVRPTTAPTPARAAVPGRATATSLPRSSSWLWPPARAPAWT